MFVDQKSECRENLCCLFFFWECHGSGEFGGLRQPGILGVMMYMWTGCCLFYPSSPSWAPLLSPLGYSTCCPLSLPLLPSPLLPTVPQMTDENPAHRLCPPSQEQKAENTAVHRGVELRHLEVSLCYWVFSLGWG